MATQHAIGRYLSRLGLVPVQHRKQNWDRLPPTTAAYCQVLAFRWEDQGTLDI